MARGTPRRGADALTWLGIGYRCPQDRCRGTVPRLRDRVGHAVHDVEAPSRTRGHVIAADLSRLARTPEAPIRSAAGGGIIATGRGPSVRDEDRRERDGGRARLTIIRAGAFGELELRG